LANRQYLRHPFPVFRIVAALCFPLFVWAGYELSVARLNPLQQMYWGDYVRTALPDMHSLNPLATFGQLIAPPSRPAAPKQDMQMMMVFSCNHGHDCLVTSSLIGRKLPGLKMMVIPMSNGQFQTWLMVNIFGHRPAPWFCFLGVVLAVLTMPILFGIGYRLDQARGLGYRREELHIRGTELVAPKEFNRRIKGDGVGLFVERPWLLRWMKPIMIRIKRELEVQHQLMYGDNGAGKTVAMFALADQFENEQEVAKIYYDPEGQFLKRYWRPGDLILGPDNRGAWWSPASEIDFSTIANAEATAMSLGESLYPGRPGTKDFFFANCARIILKHCVVRYRTTALQLAAFYTHPKQLIDATTAGTDLEEMLAQNHSGLRSSIISTLTQCLFALQQVAAEAPDRPQFCAREYVAMTGRRPSIFLTSGDSNMKVAFAPLHRLWLDSLMRGFLSLPEVSHPVVRIFVDELPVLGELSSLADAVSRGRKHGMDLVLGFQNAAQVTELYGGISKAIFSGPYTKLMLHTGEPESAKWASDILGTHDIETLSVHQLADGKLTYTPQQRDDQKIASPSDLGNLKNRVGFLNYEGLVVKFKLALPAQRPDRCAAFEPRTGTPPEQLPMPNLEQILAKEEAGRKAAANKAHNFVYQPPERSV
jgi:Type IV secretion-system coupling protein DNA-binding domain